MVVADVAPPPPTKEGWLVVRSSRKVWSPRWVCLRSGPNSGEILEISPDIRGKKLEFAIPLSRVRGARAVPQAHFGRQDCFIIVLDLRSWSSGFKELGFQSKDNDERSDWVRVVDDAAHFQVAAVPRPSLSTLAPLETMMEGPRRKSTVHIPARDDRDLPPRPVIICISGRLRSRTRFENVKNAIVWLRAKAESHASTSFRWTWPLTVCCIQTRWRWIWSRAAPPLILVDDILKQLTEDERHAIEVTLGMEPPAEEPLDPPLEDIMDFLEVASFAPVVENTHEDKGKGKGKGKKGPLFPCKGSSNDGVKGAAHKGGEAGQYKGKGKLPLPVAPGDGKKGAGKKGESKGKTDSSPASGLKLAGLKMGLREIHSSSEDTVFRGLLDDASTEHKDMGCALHRVFVTPKAKPTVRSARTIELLGTPSNERKLVDDSVATNFAIVARRLPKRGEDLALVLQILDQDALNEEHLDRLAGVVPKEDQVKRLRADTGPVETLRDIEREMLPLCRIQRLNQRVQMLQIVVKLNQVHDNLIQDMRNIEASCSELMSSQALRKVLATVLVMFNFVNYGGVSGSSKIIDITSMLRLRDFATTKGPFPGFNGMHFLAMKLLAGESGEKGTAQPATGRAPSPIPDDLRKELPSLPQGAAVDLIVMQNKLDRLQRDVAFIRKEAKENSKFYGGPDNQKEIYHSGRGSQAVCSGKVQLPDKEPQADRPSPQPPAVSKAPPSQQVEKVEEAEDDAEHGFLLSSKSGRKVRALAPFRYVQNTYREAVCGVFGAEGNIAKDIIAKIMVKPPVGAPKHARLQVRDVDNANHAGTGWQEVFTRVAAAGLLCYAKAEDAYSHMYIVVAGAKVHRVSDKEASDMAKAEAQKHPNAIELVTPTPSHAVGRVRSLRFWIDADDPALLQKWQAALESMTTTPGVGYLHVYRGMGIWYWRWAVVLEVTMPANGSDSENKAIPVMAWWGTPGQYLRGTFALGGIDLSCIAAVHSFSDKRSSKECRRMRRRGLPGFEVVCWNGSTGRERVSARLDHFMAGGQQSTDCWVSGLERYITHEWTEGEHGRASSRVRPSVGGSSRPEITDLFDIIGDVEIMDLFDIIGDVEEEDQSQKEAPEAVQSRKSSSEGRPPRVRINSKGSNGEDHEDSDTPLEEVSSEDVSESEGEDALDRPDIAYRRLLLMLRQSELCVADLKRSYKETTKQARRMLQFFGQPLHAKSSAEFCQQVRSVLQVFNDFLRLLATAFKDVERRCADAARRGLPDPVAKYFSSTRSRESMAIMESFRETAKGNSGKEVSRTRSNSVTSQTSEPSQAQAAMAAKAFVTKVVDSTLVKLSSPSGENGAEATSKMLSSPA